MNTFYLKKELKLKDGKTFPTNTEVSLSWPDQGKPWLCQATIGERNIKLKTSSLPHYFDIDPIHMEELEEAVSDGLCSSVLGFSTEPDGWDEKGSPSWLMVLGMI